MEIFHSYRPVKALQAIDRWRMRARIGLRLPY